VGREPSDYGRYDPLGTLLKRVPSWLNGSLSCLDSTGYTLLVAAFCELSMSITMVLGLGEGHGVQNLAW